MTSFTASYLLGLALVLYTLVFGFISFSPGFNRVRGDSLDSSTVSTVSASLGEWLGIGRRGKPLKRLVNEHGRCHPLEAGCE
jgi:hypothetical protein